MSERSKMICLLTRFVPLPFKTINTIADNLLQNGVAFVIQCKKCKHWNKCGEGCGWCEAWEGMRHQDNYCNYGERKK